MAHGRIVIDAERCKGCELCPQDVIKLADDLNSKATGQPYCLTLNISVLVARCAPEE